MRPIWVLGSRGQVGRHLMALLGTDAIGFDSNSLDFTRADFADALRAHLKHTPPELIINMAAYTDVAGAEKNLHTAMQINGHAVQVLCEILATENIPLIHGSTDYVFSGHHDGAYTEAQSPSPLNAYGKSKLVGEQAVSAYAHGYVMRLSWVFDAKGKSFFTTMCELMQRHQQLRVVADQIGAPSYAGDIAKALVQFAQLVISEKKPEAGMYHLCAGGDTTWHGFACAIREGLIQAGLPCVTKDILAVSTAEYGADVIRPLNSRLNTSKLAALGICMPHWREGLARCMQAMLAL